MDNNNYNNNSVKIQDLMTLSQKDRQKHIDLSSECYGYIIKQGENKGQLAADGRRAKNSLLDFYQIKYFRSRKIHTCHLCPNDSSKPNGFVCINPRHMYFGTAKENHYDKPEDVIKETVSNGGKKTGAKNGAKRIRKALKEGSHISQQLMTCPVCGFEGKGAVMKRWHYDNCKHKI